MKRLFTVAVILVCMGAHAQKMHTISLSAEALSPGSKLNFRVTKVIDGRRDKSNVGVVQKGMSNARRFAVFKSPVEDEILGLVSRSTQGGAGNDVILRIEYIAVSEQTRATSETAKAEVTMDIFHLTGDRARFIARKHATKESRGMEVTGHHARNIAAAIEEVLLHFNTYDFNVMPGVEPLIMPEEIMSFRPDPVSEINAPVLLAGNYDDGIFASFEEFLDNKPSVREGYEVREGDPLKARWVDDVGKKTRIRDDVYALAHKNTLYIFFNGLFYPLEKTSNKFLFTGPAVPDNGAILAGGIMGGAIGGAIAGAATAKKTRYWIDLSNGSLQAVPGN